MLQAEGGMLGVGGETGGLGLCYLHAVDNRFQVVSWLQVDALESLCRAIFAEVLELRSERDRALAARTLLGHLRNLLGYLLSFYCLFRYGLMRTGGCFCSDLVWHDMAAQKFRS